MNDLVGTTLGQYEIIELIGEGGMANVYRAWQPSLQRYVALKVLAPHLSGDANFVTRFHQEAVSAANLKQSHIVTIHDVGDQDGYHYIAMEFIEGGSLEDRIRSQGALPLEQVVDIIGQVGQALDYAHQRGFIHRDIKPANVLITPEGRAVLTDFGIAKAVSDSGVTAPLTKAGSIFGTPHYMSPEQIKDEPIDHRADLYALGIVCYEMLAGQVPFDGATTHAILYAQAHNPPPPLNEANPDIPPAVETVVNKMLSKPPEARYDNAGAFAAALAQAVPIGQGPAADEATVVMQKPPEQAAVTMVAPSQKRAPELPQQARTPARRRKMALLLALLGVVLVGGAIAGAVVLSGNDRPTDATQVVVEPTQTVNQITAATEPAPETAVAGIQDADATQAAVTAQATQGSADSAAATEQALAAQATQPNADPALKFKQEGDAYALQEDWQQAADSYEMWTQIAPEDSEAYLALGNARFNQGEPELAVAAFERAEEAGIDLRKIDRQLGLAYFQLARYPEAAERLKAIVAWDPEDFDTQRALGLSLSNLNQMEQAVEHLVKAVALGTDRPFAELGDVLHVLGGFYFEVADYAQAMEYFVQALELTDPDSAERKQVLNQIQQATGSVLEPLTKLSQLYAIQGDEQALQQINQQIIDQIPNPLDVVLGDQVRYLGFELHDLPDNQVQVDMYFQALESMKADYKVWLHAYVDENDVALLPPERQQFGFDNWGHAMNYPTSQWTEGAIFRNSTVHQAAPGAYRMRFGLWLPETETRLPTQDDPQGAVSLGWQLVNGSAASADVLARYGWDKLQENNPEAALWAIETALEKKPDSLEALLAASAVYGALGNQKKLVGVNGCLLPLLPNRQDETLGDKLRFVGYDIQSKQDDQVAVDLYFEVLEPMDADYTLWLHAYVDEGDIALLPADRQEYGFDNWGHPASFPTSKWAEGAIYRERTVRPAASGEYRLRFGIWLPETDTWLATLDDLRGAVDLGWHQVGSD
jgi:tetratricopeptide (TPR) repeat protein